MDGASPCTALLLAAIAVVVAVLLLAWGGRRPPGGEPFWTQYGGGEAPSEQVRPVSAEGLGETGVPNMAWAEAYWPPAYCAADLQRAASAAASPKEGWAPAPQAPPRAPALRPEGPLWEGPNPNPARHNRQYQPHWRFAPCPGQPDQVCREIPAWWW